MSGYIQLNSDLGPFLRDAKIISKVRLGDKLSWLNGKPIIYGRGPLQGISRTVYNLFYKVSNIYSWVAFRGKYRYDNYANSGYDSKIASEWTDRLIENLNDLDSDSKEGYKSFFEPVVRSFSFLARTYEILEKNSNDPKIRDAYQEPIKRFDESAKKLNNCLSEKRANLPGDAKKIFEERKIDDEKKEKTNDWVFVKREKEPRKDYLAPKSLTNFSINGRVKIDGSSLIKGLQEFWKEAPHTLAGLFQCPSYPTSGSGVGVKPLSLALPRPRSPLLLQAKEEASVPKAPPPLPPIAPPVPPAAPPLPSVGAIPPAPPVSAGAKISAVPCYRARVPVSLSAAISGVKLKNAEATQNSKDSKIDFLSELKRKMQGMNHTNIDKAVNNKKKEKSSGNDLLADLRKRLKSRRATIATNKEESDDSDSDADDWKTDKK